MHIFEIKGLSGLIAFVGATVGALAVALALPALFMMTLWNALVYELFHGPQVGFAQGALLWLAALVSLKLILNPQVSFQFRKVASDATEADKRLDP